MFNSVLKNIPEVRRPGRHLSFNEKLKWTLLILVVYFVLSQIPLYGLDPQWATDYFEAVRAIIAGHFGSIVTLGIGPIVTAGIILQMLVGIQLIPLDLSKSEDKATFQAMSQVLTIIVTLFEAVVYVFMGGLPALGGSNFLKWLLVAQLCVGTFLLVLLDDVSQKWGFISGISLFIAAGVSSQVMVAALNPLPNPRNPALPAGVIPAALSLILAGDPRQALFVLIPIIFTIIVFLLVVYTQSINVEIPLSFGRVGGMATRWPLNLFYTGNIPVILTAALIANFHLWARLLQNTGFAILGTIDQNNIPVSGLIYYLTPPRDLIYRLLSPVQFFGQLWTEMGMLVSGSFTDFYNLIHINMIIKAIVYATFMVAGAIIFSIFWVKTAGQDSKSVAKQINRAGMQIRGFRSDPRIIEVILQRYIPQLTIIGGAAVGLLATFADFTQALGGGTGILLTVMIVYRLYQSIMREHVGDMMPALKRLVVR